MSLENNFLKKLFPNLEATCGEKATFSTNNEKLFPKKVISYMYANYKFGGNFFSELMQ